MDDKIEHFPAEVHIRRVADGVTRVYVSIEEPLFNGEPWSDFWWRDGNGSCDCNRYLFFQRAADEEEDDEHRCGDSEYVIEKIIDKRTGLVLYEEG